MYESLAHIFYYSDEHTTYDQLRFALNKWEYIFEVMYEKFNIKHLKKKPVLITNSCVNI